MRKEAWCEKGSDHYATATRVAEHKESRPIRQPPTQPVSCPLPVRAGLKWKVATDDGSLLSIRRQQVRRISPDSLPKLPLVVSIDLRQNGQLTMDGGNWGLEHHQQRSARVRVAARGLAVGSLVSFLSFSPIIECSTVSYGTGMTAHPPNRSMERQVWMVW